MTTEEVKAAKDDGGKNRWALGKWIYRREGGKRRLDVKALMWISLAAFAAALIIGLLKDPASTPQGQSQSVAAPDQVTADSRVVNIDWASLDRDDRSEVPLNTQKASRKPTKTFAPLQKVKRHAELEIPPGTMALAKLVAGASDGPTRAVLTEDLVVAGESVAPAGTVLVGKGTSSKERLMIQFVHMVFKDGSHARIEAQACDESDKMPGLKGSNVRGQALKLTGAIGLGLVGGTAMGLQTKQNQAAGQSEPTMRDALLNGVAVASLEQARSLTSDVKNTKPLFEVPSGTSFYVLFAGGK